MDKWAVILVTRECEPQHSAFSIEHSVVGGIGN